MEAWRSRCVAEIASLASAADSLVSAARKLRTEARRAVQRAAAGASKMSEGMGRGVEDRKTEIWSALVDELGETKAIYLVDTDDYPSTEEEDERDEATRSELDDLPSPDVEDSMDQAVESLEAMESGLSDLLSSLRRIK